MVPSGAVTITEWGTLCRMCEAKSVGDDRASPAVGSAVPQARQYRSATPRGPLQAAHARFILYAPSVPDADYVRADPRMEARTPKRMLRITSLAGATST